MAALVSVLLVGLCIGLIAFETLSIFFSEERSVRKRMNALSKFEAGQVAEAQPLATPFKERVLRPAAKGVSSSLHKLMPKDYTSRVRQRIATAGRPGHLDVDRFVVIKLASGVGSFLFVLLLTLVLGVTTARALFVSVVAGLVLSYAPDVWLSSKIDARQKQIRRELPDMLDMLTISVEAGLGFDQAVAKYVQNASGALAHEFAISLREIQAGMSRREALHSLSDRTQVPELNAFIMAIVQADVFGVSISEVLRTQSRELRVKRRQYAEEQAQKAPAKMVFPLILCILPATMIVVIGPAVLRIMRVLVGL